MNMGKEKPVTMTLILVTVAIISFTAGMLFADWMSGNL